MKLALGHGYSYFDLLKSTSVDDEPEMMVGDGGRGGKNGALPDERTGGGLTLAGNGTELKRLL